MQLVLIFGPPAVGKMTVGRSLAARSEFRLLHNHALLEPLLEVFDYGTPPFVRLLDSMRRQVVQEAAEARVDLILTYVLGFELEGDVAELRRHLAPYLDAGARVSFVELRADLATRLERNRTEQRLAEKRSKRDVEWSDDNVRHMESHIMNTRPGDDPTDRTLPGHALLAEHPHLVLDNTHLTADAAAEQILAWLKRDDTETVAGTRAT